MQNIHQQYIADYYLKLAQQLLAGEISPETFAQTQAQLYLTLEMKASCDGLISDFLNNEGFAKILEQQLKLIQRIKLPAVLLALDIDFLKKFNDSMGHVEGDKLIKTYAQVIMKHLRISDLKARVGGDEFAIFLIGTDIENAKVVAERIRLDIVQTIKEIFSSLSWEQTISIGIAQALENDGVESLREKADKALYEAKKEKNKICVYYKDDVKSSVAPVINQQLDN